MDVHRFDALVLRLADATSRRHALGVVGGSVLGGLFVTRLSDDADAKNKNKNKNKKCKKKCGECRKCKKGKCKPKPNGTPCSTGECQNGICQGPICPPAQVCEESEFCCPSPISCTDGACFCPENFALCSCPAGTQVCPGTDGGTCCLEADTCDPSGICVTETCTAGNDVCEVEMAYCGETCACFSTAAEANVCADYSGIPVEESICPNASECANDGECGAGESCVDLSCCEPGTGFIGRCLPGCPAGREGTIPGNRKKTRETFSLLPRRS